MELKLLNHLFTKWQSADSLSSEPKLLKNAIESGTVAIVADTGADISICGLTEDAVNSNHVLFLRTTPVWHPELFFNPARMNALLAVGYLAQNETEDAGALMYSACIENAVAAADRLWERHCRFNENFSEFVILDGDARHELQDVFPDADFAKHLLKIVSRNEKKLKTDIHEFEKGYAAQPEKYREKCQKSAHMAEFTDNEYLNRFYEERKFLISAYRDLRIHIREMQELPKLFGCRNYLLRGGTYRNIPGICRLVPFAELEAKNFSLNPGDYL